MAIKSLGNGVTVVHSAALRVTDAPARRTRAARAAAPVSEMDAIVRALRDEEMALVKRVEITGNPRAKRGERAAGGDDVEVSVKLAADEDAVLLIEQNGEYHWELPDGTAIGARRAARAGGARARRKPRTVTFRVRARFGAAAGGTRRTRSARGLFGKVIALVLKFARKVVGALMIKRLEKDVKPGLVRISSTEPERWERVADNHHIPTPDGRRARVLLLVHGTFSSTVGSFSGLRHTPEGLAFLEAALRTYDVILGFDHRTLSELPEENAKQILARLNRIKWKESPEIDSIAFSRGGLVLRSLLEREVTGTKLETAWSNAVFVGCTNGGTLLAEPENWGKLVDVYTNLAAAAARGLSFVPQAKAFATILSVTIKGIGILVKYLASFIIDGGGVPGLSAMEPDGDVVTLLNSAAIPPTVALQYLAVTNDFEPSRAEKDGAAAQLPASWRMKLADGFIDQLMGEANDLVVNTAAMTTVGSAAFPGQVFALGANGRTIHTTYFRDPKVVSQLGTWLLPPEGDRKAGGRRRSSRKRSAPKRAAARRRPRRTAGKK